MKMLEEKHNWLEILTFFGKGSSRSLLDIHVIISGSQLVCDCRDLYTDAWLREITLGVIST